MTDFERREYYQLLEELKKFYKDNDKGEGG